MAKADPDSIVEEVSTFPEVCPKCGHNGHSIVIVASQPACWKCLNCGKELRIGSGLAAGCMKRYETAYRDGPTSRIGLRSEHQRNVDEFMRRAGQDVPERPCIPPENIRRLRAKLILEEAFETVTALGFNTFTPSPVKANGVRFPVRVNPKELEFTPHLDGVDFIGVVDGCGDTKVVTTGTLSAFGVPDVEAQSLIDESNLAKFKGPNCDTCGGVMELMGTGDGTQQWVCVASNYGSDDANRAVYLDGGLHPFKPKEAGPYRREDGKWIKPPDWKAPDLAAAVFKDGQTIMADAPSCPVCGYLCNLERQNGKEVWMCPLAGREHTPNGLPV